MAWAQLEIPAVAGGSRAAAQMGAPAEHAGTWLAEQTDPRSLHGAEGPAPQYQD